MRYFWLLVLLPVFARANITLDALSRDMAVSGAQKAVTTLQQEDWNILFSGVASGKTAWLKLVPELAPFADADRSAGLEDALASALTTNTLKALKVLRILDTKKYPFMIGSDVVCVPPLDKSRNDITAFYHKTRIALLETSEGARCLWILEASMNEWLRSSKR